ncbi:MAG: helix-turn-helix domain-containing protein, partial [Actinomycetota bacterium]
MVARSPVSPAGVLDPRTARSREAMLAAGVALVGREGCSAITHQRIAAEAGVGRATAYRHWPTAQDLFIDVLQHVLANELRPVTHVGETRSDLIAELSALAAAINDG